MIRRKKEYVLTMLPDKTRTAILANITDKDVKSLVMFAKKMRAFSFFVRCDW